MGFWGVLELKQQAELQLTEEKDLFQKRPTAILTLIPTETPVTTGNASADSAIIGGVTGAFLGGPEGALIGAIAAGSGAAVEEFILNRFGCR